MKPVTVEENYEYLSKLVLMAARPIRRRFPMVDLDDLLQVAWVWVCQHPRKLAEYMASSDQRRGERLIVASMRNAVKDYARRERASMYGYELEDDAFYSMSMLKGSRRGLGLLHYVFDQDAWLKPPDRDGARKSPGDPAEGNAWLAALSDVSRALDAIPERDRELIETHFKYGATYERIGAACNPPVGKVTVAKRMDGAVRKVQDFLGGFRPRHDPPEDDWEEAA